jgi:hypothetical protein
MVLSDRQIYSKRTSSYLVLPGGGYRNLAFEKEGTDVAKWLNTLGISAFVLMYRTPYWESSSCKKEIPLSDAKASHAHHSISCKGMEYQPEQNRGYGLFSWWSLSSDTFHTVRLWKPRRNGTTRASVSTRPDFSVLVYPVISMRKSLHAYGFKTKSFGENPTNEEVIAYSNELQVKTDTPPAILIHASNDMAVIAENSIMYYKALLEKNIPVALHIWEDGGHGFGLYREKGSVKSWSNTVQHWFFQRGILKY